VLLLPFRFILSGNVVDRDCICNTVVMQDVNVPLTRLRLRDVAIPLHRGGTAIIDRYANFIIRLGRQSLPDALRFTTIRAVFLVLVLSFAASSSSAQIYHDPHKKTTVGFSIDLNSSPELVTQIVRSVASDSVIRGTYMYAKDNDIDQANFATTSDVLPPGTGTGEVFYKVKTKVLSPAHFPAAGDMGTITVRYVVETVNPQRVHLAIDAVFVTDSGHRLYASDGSVETAEFAEIMTQVKAVEAPKVRHHAPQTSVVAGQETAGLQGTLMDEQNRLADAKATEAKLQQRIKQLEFNTEGRVRGHAVPLKASPYDHSSTVLTLDKGLTVTVLTTTKYWYRIRTSKGDEGWIYYAFLEPLS
jgi:hypothetical protein